MKMFATHTALLVFLEKLVASNTNEMKAQRLFSVMFIQEMSAATDGRPVDHTVSHTASISSSARSLAQLSSAVRPGEQVMLISWSLFSDYRDLSFPPL